MDPIKRPNFHLNRARPADPATVASVIRLAAEYRNTKEMSHQARHELEMAVRVAKEKGHSYSQLTEATGLSVSVIQRMVK